MRVGSTATCSGKANADGGGADAVASGGAAGAGNAFDASAAGQPSDRNPAPAKDASLGPTQTPMRDAGVPDAPPPDAHRYLHIDVGGPKALCSDTAANIPLTASGGEPPYRWEITSAPPGWALTANGGAEVALAQASVPSGGQVDLTVVLTDSANVSTEQVLDLPVRDAPHIRSDSLPTACENVPYGVRFDATGGDAGSYRWTLVGTNGSDGAFSDDILFVTPSAGDLRLTVQVADTYCESAPAAFTVPTDFDAETCPMIVAPSLPSPCKGYAYAPEAFFAEGGSPAPKWQALALPDGLGFDTGALTVSGTPRAAGPSTLTLQVVDGAGRYARAAYPLTTREHCWLAYVSTDGGRADLHRFDPELVTSYDVSQTGEGADGVQDFAFSPDGDYLVYATRGADGNVGLVLVDATTWTEHDLAFPGTIVAYAWSSDARTVAVAGKNGDDTWLSGFRVLAPEHSTMEGGTISPADVQAFEEPVALLAHGASFSSDLTWIGTNGVAFHAARSGGTDPSGQHAYYASLTLGTSGAPRGFTAPAERADQLYADDLRLEGRESGFFATQGSNPLLDFFGSDSALFYRFPPGVADPDGILAASVAGDALVLNRGAGIPPSMTTPPLASASGCSSILAWGRDRDRIVCETPSDPAIAQSPLRMFEFDPHAGTLSSADIRETGDYARNMAVERRRSVSPSGAWFALTTDSSVYVADLSDTTPRVVRSYKAFVNPKAPIASSYTQLAFSPDERFFVFQRGNAFGIQRLDHPSTVPTYVLYTPPTLSSPCSEAYTADPTGWCGGAHDNSLFRWSSDSLVVAGKMADGRIVTFNLADIDDANIDEEYACDAGCSEHYAFQP